MNERIIEQIHFPKTIQKCKSYLDQDVTTTTTTTTTTKQKQKALT